MQFWPFKVPKATFVALTLSSHHLSADRARELIEPSQEAKSLLASILKHPCTFELFVGSLTKRGGSVDVIWWCWEKVQLAIYLFFFNKLDENLLQSPWLAMFQLDISNENKQKTSIFGHNLPTTNAR